MTQKRQYMCNNEEWSVCACVGARVHLDGGCGGINGHRGLQEGDNKIFSQLKTDGAISHWRRIVYLTQVENTETYLGFRTFKI